MKNNIMDYLLSVSKSNYFFKKAFLILLIAVISISFAILVYGYISSFYLYPWPENYSDNIKEERINEGSVLYRDSLNIIPLNDIEKKSIYEKIILSDLNEFDSTKIIKSLAIMEGQIILLNDNSFLFNEIDDNNKPYNGLIAFYQNIIDSITTVVKVNGWADNNTVKYLDKTKSNLSKLLNLHLYLKKLTVISNSSINIYQPSTKYSFIIGKVKKIRYGGQYQIKIVMENPSPILKSEFIIRQGFNLNSKDESQLINDADQFNDLKIILENMYAVKIKELEKSIKDVIDPQRKSYIYGFYGKKYYSLFLLTNNIIFSLILLKFIFIVSQFKRPRKRTFTIYIATNITSNILRIFALVVLILGEVDLIINLYNILNSMIGTRESMSAYNSFLNILNFRYNPILFPLSTFITCILSSWFFLLLSEFIDFLSNCYDIVFMKSNKGDIYENQND